MGGKRWKNKKRKIVRETDADYDTIEYRNENFEKYYKAQEILKPEEWGAFMTSLAKPLPSSFRINDSCRFADAIRERIQSDFQFKDLVVDGTSISPIREIDWYPNQNAFQWELDRYHVKKLDLLKDYQKWIVSLTESGDITRQEAVSMIPPLILGVESHHKVCTVQYFDRYA